MVMSSDLKPDLDRSWERMEALEADALIERALAEDLPGGDLTSDFLFPEAAEPVPAAGTLPGMGVVAR